MAEPKIELPDDTIITVDSFCGNLCFDIPYGKLKTLVSDKVFKHLRSEDKKITIDLDLLKTKKDQNNEFTQFMKHFDNVESLSTPERSFYRSIVGAKEKMTALLARRGQNITLEEFWEAIGEESRGENIITYAIEAFESLLRMEKLIKMDPTLGSEWGMNQTGREIIQSAFDNKDNVLTLIRDTEILYHEVQTRIHLQTMNKLNGFRYGES